jgi:uncharacterized repeat protein (TIGR04076 family)
VHAAIDRLNVEAVMSHAKGKTVKIQVVKVLNGGECSSRLHCVGQSWVVSDATVPQGMCCYAYNSIGPFITALHFGGRPPWKDDPEVTVCCPDADNPVVFRLSVEDSPSEAAGGGVRSEGA